MLLVPVSDSHYVEYAKRFVVGGDEVEVTVLLGLEFINIKNTREV